MKLQEDLIHGPVGVIDILKKAILLFFAIYLQSCVIDRADLKINIVNLSKNRVYVNTLSGDCDSCEIQRDVRYFCSGKNINPPVIDTINSKGTLHFDGKLVSDHLKLYSINADSLDKYCYNGLIDNISEKKWVAVISSDINIENKTCTIVIR